ncbi:MAG TPA: ABC transporter permease [Nocardioidaceae bacterium]|nr:ABC transporter permease [Nocardioidaceae bacterium]
MIRRESPIPVTRRLLVARPVRTTAGALGIGLALMLMLLLNGLWTGVQQRVTLYDEHLGAALVVVPEGTESLFADPGVLPADTVAAVEQTPGVTRASPIRTTYLILELDEAKVAVAAVASRPGRAGGPWAFVTGRAPAAPDEVAVDAYFADEQGLVVGDALPMLGRSMRIVGLTDGTAMFMTPMVFTTADAMTSMLVAPDTTGAVLVATDRPRMVARLLRGRGLTVRTPAELEQASLTLATKVYGTPVRLMVAVAFAAGTLIVALVAHTRVSEQQRDLGILKALGATPGRVRRIAVTETVVLTALGAVAALVLLLVTRELLAWWRPAFPVAMTWETLARTAAAASAMALLAAWLPAHRLARLDAASAFRSR